MFSEVSRYLTVTKPAPRKTQLAHLVQLALDVPRVLRGGVAMTKVVSALVVGLDVHRPVHFVPHELSSPTTWISSIAHAASA